MFSFLFSGVSIQDVLKENSIDTTEENLFQQLKYDPDTVWGYVEVSFHLSMIRGSSVMLLRELTFLS